MKALLSISREKWSTQVTSKHLWMFLSHQPALFFFLTPRTVPCANYPKACLDYRVAVVCCRRLKRSEGFAQGSVMVEPTKTLSQLVGASARCRPTSPCAWCSCPMAFAAFASFCGGVFSQLMLSTVVISKFGPCATGLGRVGSISKSGRNGKRRCPHG